MEVSKPRKKKYICQYLHMYKRLNLQIKSAPVLPVPLSIFDEGGLASTKRSGNEGVCRLVPFVWACRYHQVIVTTPGRE